MNIYALAPLFSVFAYTGLGVLALCHPRRKERRAFILYLASAEFWSFISFLLHLDNPFLHQYTLPLSKALIVALVWMVVAYYHFVRVFVRRPAGLGVGLGSGFVLLLAVLAAAGFVPRNAYAVGGIVYIEHGPLLYLTYLAGFGLVVAAAYSLRQYYQTVNTPLARTRIIYLFIGLAVVVLATLTNLSESWRVYPIDHLGNLANAIIISYAILRYQLLDIRVVMRWGLAYSLLTIFLTAAYLLLLFAIHTVLLRGQAGFYTLGLATGLALAMAVGFAPLRNLIQERVDRFFYRGTYQYRRMLLNFSSRISNILDLEELAQSILTAVVYGLRARRAVLLLPDANTGDFRGQFSYGEPSPKEASEEVRLGRGNPLLTWLTREGHPLRRDLIDTLPQGNSLRETEEQSLDHNQVDLLCPIIHRESLIGVLALGEKRNGAPYNEEETELLLTMASGAALALENARMVDYVKWSRAQAEQLLAQVVAAQEEERKRISVDLHDGVAQWLVRASYQAQICQALLSRQDGAAIRKELDEVEEIIVGSVKELRRVLTDLRPSALEELGLAPALKRCLESLKGDGLSCSFEIEGTPVRLPSAVEIAVFRIVQEAINNVRKHARASQASLRLHFQENNLRIEVADNGQGFDVSRTLRSAVEVGHLGLLGMKQRAEGLGGSFNLESQKGMGTRLVVGIPIGSMVR